MKLIFNTIFFFLIFTLKTFAVEFTGNFQQGSFILGKTEKTSKVMQTCENVRRNKADFSIRSGASRHSLVII